jgi:hypothetical protein
MPVEEKMGSIPEFLLQKLYVKGSLKNTASGFELTIQNTLAPGTIVAFPPLRVDGIDCPLENTSAVLPDGTKASALNVSAESPMHFGINDKVKIEVQGPPLAPGPHKLTISAKTREAGLLQIPATDSVS